MAKQVFQYLGCWHPMERVLPFFNRQFKALSFLVLDKDHVLVICCLIDNFGLRYIIA